MGMGVTGTDVGTIVIGSAGAGVKVGSCIRVARRLLKSVSTIRVNRVAKIK